MARHGSSLASSAASPPVESIFWALGIALTLARVEGRAALHPLAARGRGKAVQRQAYAREQRKLAHPGVPLFELPHCAGHRRGGELELLFRHQRRQQNQGTARQTRPPRRQSLRLLGQRLRRPLHRPEHVWQRIRRRAQLPEVRLHDARHTYASFGAAAGMGLPILGALLGHKQPVTTARYAHLANDPLRAAAVLGQDRFDQGGDGRPTLLSPAHEPLFS
jgi:integrase